MKKYVIILNGTNFPYYLNSKFILANGEERKWIPLQKYAEKFDSHESALLCAQQWGIEDARIEET